MRLSIVGLFIILLPVTPVIARPLITEEVSTIGRKAFEAGVSMAVRNDQFNSPAINYRTVNFPFQARIGIHEKVDLGFYLTYVSQRIETQDMHLSGSQNGRLSPFMKISPWNNLGLMAIFHTNSPEEGDDVLPVVRGTDYEPVALLKLPTEWPLNINVGYVFRGGYQSKLGVSNGPAHHVVPGNIFEAKTALEIPLNYHISILGELAYYNFSQTTIAGIAIPDSAGEALDGTTGITWAFAGWNIGLGASFGLLDEQHTSFDLERGAGDIKGIFSVSYKLVPKRPGT